MSEATIRKKQQFVTGDNWLKYIKRGTLIHAQNSSRVGCKCSGAKRSKRTLLANVLLQIVACYELSSVMKCRPSIQMVI